MQSGIECGDERHRGIVEIGVGYSYVVIYVDCDFGIARNRCGRDNDCEVNPLRGSISGRYGCFISGAARTRMLVRNIIRSLIIIIVNVLREPRYNYRRCHTHRHLFELGPLV